MHVGGTYSVYGEMEMPREVNVYGEIVCVGKEDTCRVTYDV